ncbi:MAG TPA: ankyrin repeat domain-containing protein [Gemmatimonadaceae bacterium]|nr:ankyrin repeat domain-containing protein [Gemmatimonadaceae bacterium]
MSELPPSPDLSYERKHAKALLRDCRAGNADAIARVAAHLPRLVDTVHALKLADAQLVIARERGFESWAKLKAHIDAALPADQQMDALLAAVETGRPGIVTRLLGHHPDLPNRNLFAAAAAGDADAVARHIAAEPAAVLATHGTHAWPPLAYLCAARVYRTSARRAASVLRAAELLLAAGASPNSHSLYFESPQKPVPISVLYHACMSDNVPLVTLLLDRGANTQDGESIYHAAQLDRRACLEALLAHGADLSSAQSPYGNTPLYFLVGHHDDEGGRALWFKGLAWLLEHGADPNVASSHQQETPLHGIAASAPKMATARALLAHGADPTLPRGDGRTAYAIAVRHGNTELAALLREHGADAEALAPEDELFGACFDGDAARARAVLAAHAELGAAIAVNGGGALSDAVAHDNPAAIRVLLEVGASLGGEAAGRGTALHLAAWTGKLEMVRRLLELGAPLEVRDSQFGGSPLGWAIHGSGQHRGHDATYIAIVDALLAAGASRQSPVNKWGTPPEESASPGVAKYLATIGFVPRRRAASAQQTNGLTD